MSFLYTHLTKTPFGRIYHILFILLCLAVTPLSHLNAQDKSESLKAVFLYNLLNYITWPDDKDNITQKLCILGENPFGNALAHIKTKAKNREHKITTNFIPLKVNTAIGPVDNCHMLYITAAGQKTFNANIKTFEENNILTVSDIKGFSKKGAIELKRAHNKIILIINKRNLEKLNLKASSKLLRIAKVI
ncbi:MAG: hypothetical protein ACI9TY_001508 [Alphaproteobacteria bacterium]|jgi:hypothetical protein